MQSLTTDILVIGGTTSGTAAAIQAARRGTNVILVSEFEWLGGMLTSAGVTAPDGNELDAWQTGIWGQFLRELETHQPGGLDNAWVSFFTYEPRIGAEIFARWVTELPNLTWIKHQTPISVQRTDDRITGVTTQDYRITAQITIDATELGDLLPLGNIPHRWGWELQAEFNEPSAPKAYEAWMHRYPIQVPTWVIILQDYGEGNHAPPIPCPKHADLSRFETAWENYGSEKFLNYGRLPGDRFMINWPISGNDYGEGVARLIQSPTDRETFGLEAQRHSLAFAHFIQSKLGDRYGLATDVFPTEIFPEAPNRLHPALALHPYHRESRRIIGLTTLREQDLLPQNQATAPLSFSTSAMGCDHVESCCTSIAIGNYPNDHHYPSGDIALAPKSIQWGGRWTGTPFTIPYTTLIPAKIDGFLACEKNISVTHMANGATRLQPLVLAIGQAVGMAAALCIKKSTHPRNLPVRDLQNALLTDILAPAAVIPLYNLPPSHPQWHHWQTYYLDHPEAYPRSGNAPTPEIPPKGLTETLYTGRFQQVGNDFQILFDLPVELSNQVYQLVTLSPEINRQLQTYPSNTVISCTGHLNAAGTWFRVESLRSNL
jgi:FAD dependent oxidoreductase